MAVSAQQQLKNYVATGNTLPEWASPPPPDPNTPAKLPAWARKDANQAPTAIVNGVNQAATTGAGAAPQYGPVQPTDAQTVAGIRKQNEAASVERRKALDSRKMQTELNRANNIAAKTDIALNHAAAQAALDAEAAKQKIINARVGTLANAAGDILESTKTKSANVGEKVSKLPTPGGIAALIGVLLFFIWVVVPVNASDGRTFTRLQLLYLTVMGKTTLAGEVQDAFKGIPGFTQAFAKTDAGQRSATDKVPNWDLAFSGKGTLKTANLSLTDPNGTGFTPDFGVAL